MSKYVYKVFIFIALLNVVLGAHSSHAVDFPNEIVCEAHVRIIDINKLPVSQKHGFTIHARANVEVIEVFDTLFSHPNASTTCEDIKEMSLVNISIVSGEIHGSSIDVGTVLKGELEYTYKSMDDLKKKRDKGIQNVPPRIDLINFKILDSKEVND